MPCPPEQADGSPTNYSCVLKLLPDIVIKDLIQSNGVFCGVDFTWDYESTFVLQASTDMQTWTNVSYVWSYPPETVWTTNAPLNALGRFFRLSMAANSHRSDLPPLTAGAIAPQSAGSIVKPHVLADAPRVVNCKLVNDKAMVTISTQANQYYTVSAVDSSNHVCATRAVAATGEFTTVGFARTNLPTPVYFRASKEAAARN